MRSNLTPWPISTGEWIAVVLFGSIAVLVAVVVAANDVNLPALLGVAFLSGYGVVSGRIGLRRGYNVRDRLLLLFGELLACGLIIGLVLNPIAG